MTTTDGVSEIEFVNDWSELEAAVETFKHYYDRGFEDFDIENYLDDVECLISYVPRLLTQYAKLVELSFALTEGWETYATLNAPTGLYLPDHG